MDEWQEDRESLVDLFGRVRDDWIENDFSGWIGANRWLIYEIIGVYFLIGLMVWQIYLEKLSQI